MEEQEQKKDTTTSSWKKMGLVGVGITGLVVGSAWAYKKWKAWKTDKRIVELHEAINNKDHKAIVVSLFQRNV